MYVFSYLFLRQLVVLTLQSVTTGAASFRQSFSTDHTLPFDGRGPYGLFNETSHVKTRSLYARCELSS